MHVRLDLSDVLLLYSVDELEDTSVIHLVAHGLLTHLRVPVLGVAEESCRGGRLLATRHRPQRHSLLFINHAQIIAKLGL